MHIFKDLTMCRRMQIYILLPGGSDIYSIARILSYAKAKIKFPPDNSSQDKK